MKDEKLSPPLRQVIDLADISQAGANIAVSAGGDDLARLASWAGVDAVRRFEAAVELRKLAPTRFSYAADLVVDITQSCVVSLAPVETRISRHIERELHLVPRLPSTAGELTLAAGDEDIPEMIENLHYDLAGPLQEELALAIDPYPRAPGAEYAPAAEREKASESPFAVLKNLKKSS